MTNNSDKNRGGIQVISRAARILRALKDRPDGLSLGQIAAQVNLPRSTVQRIVNALQSERLLISNMTGNGVRLGPELGALAEQAKYDTAEQCKPLLVELTDQTGETSDLSVMRDDKMVFIDQVSGTQRLRAISSIGEVFPVSMTANGRACLAELPRDQAIEIAKLEAKSQAIAFDESHLNRLLDKISQEGLAYDCDEHSDGISAVGFAFKDYVGEIHAISVPVPTSRFMRKQSDIEAALQQTAQTIRSKLSG